MGFIDNQKKEGEIERAWWKICIGKSLQIPGTPFRIRLLFPAGGAAQERHGPLAAGRREVDPWADQNACFSPKRRVVFYI